MSKLQGKIAVVTGGNSGMGLETARLFVREGATVIITGRRQKELDDAVNSIKTDGGASIEGLQGDVSNLGDLDRLASHIKQKHGRVDVLFANAGLGELAPLEAASEAHFDKTFDVNVKGLFFTVQKLLPLMKEGSSIILNASIAARLGMGAFSVYCATKAAVRSFARSWTVELAPRKIRVNAISPGPIETPIFGKMGLSDQQASEFGQSILTKVPMGRMGQSGEIAKTALFLASDDSSYITGVDLCVDGGMAQV